MSYQESDRLSRIDSELAARVQPLIQQAALSAKRCIPDCSVTDDEAILIGDRVFKAMLWKQNLTQWTMILLSLGLGYVGLLDGSLVPLLPIPVIILAGLHFQKTLRAQVATDMVLQIGRRNSFHTASSERHEVPTTHPFDVPPQD